MGGAVSFFSSTGLLVCPKEKVGGAGFVLLTSGTVADDAAPNENVGFFCSGSLLGKEISELDGLGGFVGFVG